MVLFQVCSNGGPEVKKMALRLKVFGSKIEFSRTARSRFKVLGIEIWYVVMANDPFPSFFQAPLSEMASPQAQWVLG